MYNPAAVAYTLSTEARHAKSLVISAGPQFGFCRVIGYRVVHRPSIGPQGRGLGRVEGAVFVGGLV